jgi:hypothetical protein
VQIVGVSAAIAGEEQPCERWERGRIDATCQATTGNLGAGLAFHRHFVVSRLRRRGAFHQNLQCRVQRSHDRYSDRLMPCKLVP